MKKIIIVLNLLVILVLLAVISPDLVYFDYIEAWLLFLVPLIIFDVIMFCIPKFSKKLFGAMKKDSEKISLSRKIIYTIAVLFSLGFIFAATLVVTSFAGRLFNGPEKHEAPTINNKF